MSKTVARNGLSADTVSLASGVRPKIRDLWRYRELLRSLVVRDIMVKYKRSFLGLLWTLMNPIFTVMILITVFSYVIRIKIDNYWAFLLSGFFVWSFISQALLYSTNIISNNAALSRNVYFPREILVLSAAISKMVEFFIEVSIILVVLLVFHFHSVPSSFLALPLLFLIQFILAIGLMYPLAVISVFFYDAKHALPILITALFYITPVFYPISMIPEAARFYYFLNPFVSIIHLYHVVLYQGAWPSSLCLIATLLSAILICLLGYSIFNRYKGICVEIA